MEFTDAIYLLAQVNRIGLAGASQAYRAAVVEAVALICATAGVVEDWVAAFPFSGDETVTEVTGYYAEEMSNAN